jgi:hypothetical protein
MVNPPGRKAKARLDVLGLKIRDFLQHPLVRQT